MRLNSIQVLRAVAAISVVIGHVPTRLARTFPLSTSGSFFVDHIDSMGVLQSGVDIFFVISGFIMLYVHRNAFAVPGATHNFLLKRFIRIVPIYWMLTTTAVVLMVIIPSVFTYRTHLEPLWIIGSYLFFPVTDYTGAQMPIIGAGWTLNYEMFFYGAFGVALLFPKKSALIGIVSAFCIAVLLGTVLQPAWAWPKVVTNWLLLEFLLGIGVALIVTEYGGVPRRAALPLIACGVTWIALTVGHFPQEGPERFFMWGLPAALIVCGTTALEMPVGRMGKFLMMLGDASYSIYLFQVFALPGLALVLRAGHMNVLPLDVLTPVLAVLATASGVLCWYVLERPAIRYLSQMAKAHWMRPVSASAE